MNVAVPKLQNEVVIVPGSLTLVFNLVVSGDANNFLVNNVARALVESSGWSSRHFGRSFSPRCATFLGQSLMSHRPPQCTKQIFFFCLTKNYPTGAKSSFKYALNFINVTSRYNKAEPLTSKKSAEVAKAFQNIYKRRPMKWPQLLQVDPGSACSDTSMP